MFGVEEVSLVRELETGVLSMHVKSVVMLISMDCGLFAGETNR